MKKLLLFISVIVTFFYYSCDNNNVMGPVEYHNKILLIYNEMDSMVVVLANDVYNKDITVEGMENDYEKIIDMTKRNLDELSLIKKLSDDPGFLTSVIEYNRVCDEVVKINFKNIIDIYSDKDWTDEKGWIVDNLMKEFYSKIIDKEENVRTYEENFALKYGIVLTEN